MTEHDPPDEKAKAPSPAAPANTATSATPASLPANAATGASQASPPANAATSPPTEAQHPPSGEAPPGVAPTGSRESGLSPDPHGFTLLDPVASPEDVAPQRPLADDFESQETVLPPHPRVPVREPPRRRGAEQTGETGIFTDRPAFDRTAGLAPGTDELPELNLPRHDTGWQYVTGRRPHGLRRVLLGRVLPVALLLGVTAWSWQLLSEVKGRTGPAKAQTAEEREHETATPSIPSDAQTAAPDAPDDDDALIGATKIPRVLAAFAENVAPDGSVGNIPLRQAIEAKRVTVINLWATWCTPCKAELPEFARMFAENRWGADVRFLPLMVRDPVDARAAHRQVAGLMPPFKNFLVDRDLDVNPLAGLIAAKLLPQELDLPVTLLVDCQRRVRKVYRHALTTPEEFAELAAEIKRLRQQLSRRYCDTTPDPDPTPAIQTPTPPPQAAVPTPGKRKPDPITPATAGGGPDCGDKVCDRKRGETCLCKQDCPCARDESCQARDHDMVCLPAVKVEI